MPRVRGEVLRAMGIRRLRDSLSRQESMHGPYIAGYEPDVGF
jgi:hypothetical protein